MQGHKVTNYKPLAVSIRELKLTSLIKTPTLTSRMGIHPQNGDQSDCAAPFFILKWISADIFLKYLSVKYHDNANIFKELCCWDVI